VEEAAEVSVSMSPEEAVRAFFDCYTNGRPQDFEGCVAPDYIDYGHEPPGIGPDGARADYESAIRRVGGVITYVIDALVADDDIVTVAWTGTIPNGAAVKGLSLYKATGGLLRWTRHALYGDVPG
jgi:hypothetical protein